MLAAIFVASLVWVALRGVAAKGELSATIPIAHEVELDLQNGNAKAAELGIQQIGEHASAATSLTSDPIWRTLEFVPVIGQNLRALGDISATMNGLAVQAKQPFTDLASKFSVSGLLPTAGKINANELIAARPDINAANNVIQAASRRANLIDTTFTIPPVDAGVKQFRTVLGTTASAMDAVRRASLILPDMVGESGPRSYLLIFQNNAELRASGGIPGSLALVAANKGSMHLKQQPAATDFPEEKKTVVSLPATETALYSDRLGTFMQDVTLTPNFPTTAKIASAFWKQKYHQDLDGVVSFDPVGLSYILRATGPLTLPNGDKLTSQNAVQKLLSGVYAKYKDPQAQDAYFRTVASTVFGALTDGRYSPSALLDAFTEASQEHRVLIWSAKPSEESVISGTSLNGILPKDNAAQTRIGVYLNDDTGAKMDYYLRTAISQAQRVCYANGAGVYRETVTLSSIAPKDAATALPGYVTGGGLFGVDPGLVKTRVVIYGPSDASAVGVTSAGVSLKASSGVDGTRPVVYFNVLLKPGASQTVTIDFRGKHPIARTLSTVQTPQVVNAKIRTGTVSCTAGTK